MTNVHLSGAGKPLDCLHGCRFRLLEDDSVGSPGEVLPVLCALSDAGPRGPDWSPNWADPCLAQWTFRRKRSPEKAIARVP